jgi:hypothetical protein
MAFGSVQTKGLYDKRVSFLPLPPPDGYATAVEVLI